MEKQKFGGKELDPPCPACLALCCYHGERTLNSRSISELDFFFSHSEPDCLVALPIV